MAKQRISLTNAQLHTGPGSELLNLCTSITADGWLSSEEIVELRRWLRANASCDLPAVPFLTEVTERVVATGKVSREGQVELHRAIESVMPPVVRKGAVSERREIDAAVKTKERADRAAVKEQERAERQRNVAVRTANFMVAGVKHEGRGSIIERYVEEGQTVYLVREPGNAYSANAIEVLIENGMQIGYVPEEYAPSLAPLLDEGCLQVAVVCKMLDRARPPIPVVQAYLYRPDSDAYGAIGPDKLPARRAAPALARSPAGCLSLVTATGLAILLLAVVA